MQSAYSLANAKLAEIRERNEAEFARRRSEVRSKCPEYSAVEAQLHAAGLALTRCVLDGAEQLGTIRQSIEKAQAEKKRILKKLDLPENYLDGVYSCERCRDTGFDENGHRCECLKRMISEYIGVNSNMTELMRAQTFESFDFSLFSSQPDVKGRSVLDVIKKAHAMALAFADGFGTHSDNLYFYGDAGKGKTYLSSCVANRVLSKGYSVYYQSAFRLMDIMEKLKFGRYDEEEAPQAEYEAKYAYDTDLLIIDDVGTEFVTAYSSAAMYDLINSRLNLGKNTIISSNLAPSGIDRQYGERMMSRIVGAYKPIPFIGMDLRRMELGRRKKC